MRVTDITYIPAREGWLCLAAGPAAKTETALRAEERRQPARRAGGAFQNAVAPGVSGRLTGLLHHSDQGSQYASNDFTALPGSMGVEQSMSRRGNCCDNAAMESFPATLQNRVLRP